MADMSELDTKLDSLAIEPSIAAAPSPAAVTAASDGEARAAGKERRRPRAPARSGRRGGSGGRAGPAANETPPLVGGLKVFVGGLSHDVTEAAFKHFFEQFGVLTDTVIMHDFVTRRPRGFGFVTFRERASVDKLLANKFYELNGCRVEVKEAVPRERMRKAAAPASGVRKEAESNTYDKPTDMTEYGSYVYEPYSVDASQWSSNYRMVYPPGPVKGGAMYGSKPSVPTGIPVQNGFAPPLVPVSAPYGPDAKLSPVMPLRMPAAYVPVQNASSVPMPMPVGIYSGMPAPYHESYVYPPGPGVMPPGPLTPSYPTHAASPTLPLGPPSMVSAPTSPTC